MNEVSAHSGSTFAANARQQVRTALELAAQRSPESASRIAAELTSLSMEAGVLGLSSIADLARRGSEQARNLDHDHTAVTACARTLRELGRALEALERTSAAAQQTAARPRVRGRVLVVDDSPLNAAVVCDALQRAAFETRQAEDGDAAVAAVAQFSPDVVLADVHMPDSTPGELCTRLRGAAGTRVLHVMLFSGMPDDELAELTRQTSADGFLSKDRGLDAVVEEIARVCRRPAV